MEQKKYFIEEKTDSRQKVIRGHFLFDRKYDSIYKKFVKNWNCYVVNIRPKDLRIASASSEALDKGIEAA